MSLALCVALFTVLGDELGGRAADNARYAVQHRDIVARFGRFPHRNQLLGRPSTQKPPFFLLALVEKTITAWPPSPAPPIGIID